MIVNLRKIELSDTANIVKWRNSDNVRSNLFTQSDLTEEQHINWFHSKVEPGYCAQYIIEVDDEGILTDIGTTFIKRSAPDSEDGEFGIFIGDVLFRGRHLATIATNEMLSIGFAKLGLNRIWLSVFEDNIPAIRAYKNVGFKLIPEKIEYVRGKKVLYMEISNNDYNIRA